MNYEEYEKLCEKVQKGEETFDNFYNKKIEQFKNSEISLQSFLELGLVENDQIISPRPKDYMEKIVQHAIKDAHDIRDDKSINPGFYLSAYRDGLITFEQFINFLRQKDIVNMFIANDQVQNVFEYLLTNDMMSLDNLQYLAKNLTSADEMSQFYEKHPFLVKKLLENNLLDRETIELYNSQMMYLLFYSDFFDWLKKLADGHEEMTNLIVLYEHKHRLRKFSCLTEDQLDDLAQKIVEKKPSLEDLKKIEEQDLHSLYTSYDTVERLLLKDLDKKKAKFNM